MAELTASETWLYSVLAGDATLADLIADRVSEWPAPRDMAYPLVTYQFQNGHDTPGVSGVRIMTHETYLIRAIGRGGSYTDLKPIAKRIDELLQRESGATADGQVLSCVREQPYKLTYVDSGIFYKELGGFYHLQVSAS